MKAYISPDVQARLFGNESPNDVLKELVRWMATPSYQNNLKKRGMSDSDSWVDVFKMAVIGNPVPVPVAPVKPVKEDLTDDLDIAADISF
jgi:hypothetical protein